MSDRDGLTDQQLREFATAVLADVIDGTCRQDITGRAPRLLGRALPDELVERVAQMISRADITVGIPETLEDE